jgi:hypothetical protein
MSLNTHTHTGSVKSTSPLFLKWRLCSSVCYCWVLLQVSENWRSFLLKLCNRYTAPWRAWMTGLKLNVTRAYLSSYFTSLCQIQWIISGSYITNFWYLIYLLTTIGLTPGGNSTVHIYTQTVHRTTQLTTLFSRLSGIRTQSGHTKIND